MKTIKLTDQEIQILGKGLALLPFGEVQALITNISKQLETNDTSGTEPTALE